MHLNEILETDGDILTALTPWTKYFVISGVVKYSFWKARNWMHFQAIMGKPHDTQEIHEAKIFVFALCVFWNTFALQWTF